MLMYMYTLVLKFFHVSNLTINGIQLLNKWLPTPKLNNRPMLRWQRICFEKIYCFTVIHNTCIFFYRLNICVLLENRPFIKFIENHIWHSAGAHCTIQILTNEDIHNFTDIMFDPWTVLKFGHVWSKHPQTFFESLRQSLEIFRNLR